MLPCRIPKAGGLVGYNLQGFEKKRLFLLSWLSQQFVICLQRWLRNMAYEKNGIQILQKLSFLLMIVGVKDLWSLMEPRFCLVLPLVVYFKNHCPSNTQNSFLGQWDGSMDTVSDHQNWCLIPRTHLVEGENWHLRVALWPLHKPYNTYATLPQRNTWTLLFPSLEIPEKLHLWSLTNMAAKTGCHGMGRPGRLQL